MSITVEDLNQVERWTPERLSVCLTINPIEPPLSSQETVSLIGLLNEVPPVDEVDAELRYNIKMSCIRAEDYGDDSGAFDARHYALNSLLKCIRAQNQ